MIGRRKISGIVAMLLAAVFLAPQLYKSLHLFTDHHGHLNCEAFQKKASGINAHSDHCPICKFHFTTFEAAKSEPENSQPVDFTESDIPLIQEYYHTWPNFYYRLRAPPVC